MNRSTDGGPSVRNTKLYRAGTMHVSYGYGYGVMAEWFKAVVLKTSDCNRSVSSNLTYSAGLSISNPNVGLREKFLLV